MKFDFTSNEYFNGLSILLYIGIYYGVVTIVYLFCLSVGEAPKYTDITGSIPDILIAIANIILACVALTTAKKWSKEQTIQEVKDGYIAYTSFYYGTLRLIYSVDNLINNSMHKNKDNVLRILPQILIDIEKLLIDRNIFREKMLLCKKIHRIETKSIYKDTVYIEMILQDLKIRLTNPNLPIDSKGELMGDSFILTINKETTQESGSILNAIYELKISDAKKEEDVFEYISKKLILDKLNVNLYTLHVKNEGLFDNFL